MFLINLLLGSVLSALVRRLGLSRGFDRLLAPTELPLRFIESMFPLAPDVTQAEVERAGGIWLPAEEYYFLDDPSSRRLQRWQAVLSLGRQASPSFWTRRRWCRNHLAAGVRLSVLLAVAALAGGCSSSVASNRGSKDPLPTPKGLVSTPYIYVDFVDADHDGKADPFTCVVGKVEVKAYDMVQFKRELINQCHAEYGQSGSCGVMLRTPVGFNPPRGLVYQLDAPLRQEGFRVFAQWE